MLSLGLAWKTEARATNTFSPPSTITMTMYRLTEDGERLAPIESCTPGSNTWGSVQVGSTSRGWKLDTFALPR
jgi:hypothetical protein